MRATTRVEPDLEFIGRLIDQAGGTFKRCFQCGTCSSACELSPQSHPFPRKEMAWSSWGLRDRLVRDVDVWLCFQCEDCSSRCPRGGRPGDVMAAIRLECVREHAVPRALGQWLGRPTSIPVLLGICAAILCATLLARGPLEETLGLSQYDRSRISYSYSSMLPHWLLNGLFGLVTLLAVAVTSIGIRSQWLDFAAGSGPPVRPLLPSLGAALRRVFTHEDFARCESSRSRDRSHRLVFFGILALVVVTLRVITSGVDPLLGNGFVYPFGFWTPWKLLANLGGLAVVSGALLMVRDRLRAGSEGRPASAADWTLLVGVLAVAISGFTAEILHYARFEPHRHAAYFVHLVLVLALLIHLPYGKLGHLAYRTAALVFAERYGRTPSPVRRASRSGARS